MTEMNFFGGCRHGGTEIKASWNEGDDKIELWENNNSHRKDKCLIRLEKKDMIELGIELEKERVEKIRNDRKT